MTKTFYITYYSNKDKKHITRQGKHDDKSITTPKSAWENDFKIWVIGTSYCHSRQFKVDENTMNFFKMYRASADNVIKEHEQMYSYVEGKMKTLRLGLKS